MSVRKTDAGEGYKRARTPSRGLLFNGAPELAAKTGSSGSKSLVYLTAEAKRDRMMISCQTQSPNSNRLHAL